MFLKHKTICLLASSALAGMIAAGSVAHAAAGSGVVGLSSDGSVMLSEVYDISTGKYVYQLTSTATGQTQTITPPSGAGYLALRGLSADGKTVIGSYYDGTAHRDVPFLWTAAGGFVEVADANVSSYFASVSGDGKAVAGYDWANYNEAFYWTAADGKIGLGSLGGLSSRATAISRDGTTVVGTADTLDGKSHAFLWKVGDEELHDIDTLSGNSTAALVSNDGSAVAGSWYTSASSPYHVFHWTEAGGMVDIGDLGGSYTFLNAMSGDGNVLVGNSYLEGNLSSHAYRYVASTDTMTDLETLGGTYSSASDVNLDGSVVVGASTDAQSVQHGFRWTEATGMISVEDWLESQGGTLGTDMTETAEFVSDDGNVIVGRTTNDTIYIARVVEDNGCPPSANMCQGGGGGGTGIIDTAKFYPTVATASNVVVQGGVNSADTIMFGAQGAPMRSLLTTGQRSVWGTVDGGYDNGANADGGLALGEFGFGYGIADGVTARFAVGGTYTDQDLDAGGNVRQRGFYLSPEVSADLGRNIYMTVGGYWGRSSVDSSRGYLNGAVTDYSTGDTNAETWGAKIRFDWLNAITVDNIAITPYVGLSYAHTKVDAFTETGGSFPVNFDETSDHSTILRLGADFVRPLNDTVRLLAKAELDYQFEDHAAATRGTLVGISDFDLDGQDLKQFWARGGVGAEFDLGKGVASFMVNATTKGQDPDVWVRSNWTVKF